MARLRSIATIGAAALAAAACTGHSSTEPLPSSGAADICSLFTRSSIQAVAGAKDPTIEYTDPIGDANDPNALFTTSCKVLSGDDFSLNARVEYLISDKERDQIRDSIDNQVVGKIRRFPASFGHGVARETATDRVTSDVVVGSYRVTIKIVHPADRPDHLADIMALTYQAAAAIGLSADPSAPRPSLPRTDR